MRITGYKELAKNLERLARNARKYVVGAEIANQIREDAKARVPNDTGELEASYHSFNEGNSLFVGYGAEYASYQHQGRRRDGSRIIRNRPAGGETYFLKNTLIANKNKYAVLIGRDFFKSIKFGIK